MAPIALVAVPIILFVFPSTKFYQPVDQKLVALVPLVLPADFAPTMVSDFEVD